MAARIEFEGAGEPLLAFLQKAREGTAALLDGVEKTNASTKKFGAEGAAQAEKFAQGVTIASNAVSGLNKSAASGVIGKLAKELEGAARGAELSQEAFAELVANAKQAAKEQGVVVKSIDAGKKAILDTLVAAKGLTAEEAKLVQEAIEVQDAFANQLRSMTQFVSVFDQVAEAQGRLARTVEVFGELSPQAQEASTEYRKLAGEAEKVNAAIGRLSQLDPFTSVFDQLSAARRELEIVVERTGELSPETAKAAQVFRSLRDEAEKLAAAIDRTTQGEQPFVSVFDKLASARQELELVIEKTGALSPETLAAKQAFDQLTASANATNVEIEKLTTPKGFVDITTTLASARQELRQAVQEFGPLSTQAANAGAKVRELDAAAKQVDIDLDKLSLPTQPAQAAGSLRSQLRAAREELARLEEASDGKITPELVAAAQRAGILQDRLGDINATIQAFNPDAKFQAFSQVVQSGAGALTAFQGVMGLVGVESDNVGKALLKVQSALAITQGLQAFFGGFRDGVRNIRAVLLSMTLAQKGATAATVVDTAAKEAQTVATTTTTAATGGLSTALNALKATLLANPITAILVVLAAAATAMIAFAAGTKEATKSYDDLIASIKKGFDLDALKDEVKRSKELVEVERGRLQRIADVKAGKRESADQTKQEVEEERRLRKLADDEAIFNIRERRRAEEAAFREIQDIVNRGQAPDASPTEQRNALAALGLPDAATVKEQNEAVDKIVAANAESKAKAITDIAAIEAAGIARAADNLDKEVKTQQERLKATRDFNNALLKEIDRLNKEIVSRIERANLDAATPRDRIALEQQIKQREIDALQLSLTRKLALLELEKTLSVEAINKMSEAQQNARADALIAEGKVNLTPEQLKNFDTLRFQVKQEGERALTELLIKEANARIEVIANAQDREQAQFEAGLTAKLQALRESLVPENEIQAFADRQRAAYAAKRTNDAIKVEEDIALAQVDAQIAAAGENERLVFTLEQRKLDLQKSFAQARLAAIVQDGSKEAEAQKAALEKIIAEIDAAKAKLTKEQEPVSILGLLGIKKEDEAEVSAGLNSILNSVQQIITQAIAARQAEVDAQISATDQLIADADRRDSELQAQLEREKALNEQGLANNLDATIAAIAANKAAEDKALADKKRLIEEKKKLAKQQAIAESIQQASSLLTAGATLFAKGAFEGTAGIITSIATIAAMIASFVALKGKVSAATQFRYGGVQMLDGPDHFQGGLAVIDRRTGQVQAEAEGGEAAIAFTRREHAQKAMPYLRAINENDISKVHELASRELRILTTNNVEVDRSEVKKVVVQKERFHMATTIVQREDNDGVRKEIRALRSDVQGFRQQEGDREQVTVIPPKSTVIRKRRGKTDIIEPA